MAVPSILFLLVLAAAPGAVQADAPLTPWGVATQSYSGSTYPDSVRTHLATTGALWHRPLAVQALLEGMEASAAGRTDAAHEAWALARQWDPAYVTPQVVPAIRMLWHNPLGAVRMLLELPKVLGTGFRNQLLLATNLLLLLLFPLLLASMAVGLLIFGRHAPALHHLLWENLQLFMPRRVAKYAVWGLLLLPVIWNLGVLLWVALLLAVTCPLLTHPERRFALGLLVIIALTPLGVTMAARIVGPADPAHSAATLWRTQGAGYSPAAMQELQLLEQHRGPDGTIDFVRSLVARQGDDPDGARHALQRAAASGDIPAARIAAAHGILAFREGQLEQAIRHLVNAAEADPNRFSVRYNLAKSYARASLFLKADREMHQAFRLDAGQARMEEQRRLETAAADMIEERLSARDIWRLLWRAPQSRAFQMPTALAHIFPGGNPRLLWMGLALLPVAAFLSNHWRRRLTLHTCCQCGRTVCRRCLKRRDRRVFCSDCALTAARWASAQYTQILLTKLLGRHDRLRDHLLDVGRFVIPGLGAILRGDLLRGYLQAFITAAAILWLAFGGLPVRPMPWMPVEEQLLPVRTLGIGLLLVSQATMVASELRGLRKRMSLKQFLGAARPRAARTNAA